MQVIGRIVRRHALLQVRDDLPPLLDQGYVFLANSQSQEGLLQAGAQINTLTTQAPELGTQTVVTIIGDAAQVQVVRSGEPLSLLVSPTCASIVDTRTDATSAPLRYDAGSTLEGTPFAGFAPAAQALLSLPGGEGMAPASAQRSLTEAFALTQASLYRYPRRADAPALLRGEQLPPVAADFEAGLAACLDSSREVLADRLRSRVQVQRHDTDLFGGKQVSESGEDIGAGLSPEAVAERAEQIRLRLPEANDREGVFPPDLNLDERAIAEKLDGDAQVTWWHRNPSKAGVGLYRWDEGEGFYPDFEVCLAGRSNARIALLEIKGAHFWGLDSEVDKTHAVHRDYGAVFMAGRKRGEKDFVFLRDLDGKLQSAGAFSIDRLRFD